MRFASFGFLANDVVFDFFFKPSDCGTDEDATSIILRFEENTEEDFVFSIGALESVGPYWDTVLFGVGPITIRSEDNPEVDFRFSFNAFEVLEMFEVTGASWDTVQFDADSITLRSEDNLEANFGFSIGDFEVIELIESCGACKGTMLSDVTFRLE